MRAALGEYLSLKTESRDTWIVQVLISSVPELISKNIIFFTIYATYDFNIMDSQNIS